MSEDDFLARWSRRKQAARDGQAEPRPEPPAEANAPAVAGPDVAEPCPAELDLSSLPPIESIDAATDVSAFLRKGIPQELSRAALRRAWSADPAIRDFIGLAENAWDFNDPTAMPGFGPLDYSAEQVDALVRRVVGDFVQAAENATNPIEGTVEDAMRPTVAAVDDLAQASNPVKARPDLSLSDESATAELPPNSAAPQLQGASEETAARRRTHGGALPR
ncbi:DUF3306 domain-containing protein [Bradyrhizobium septentrionale]|uniref:DUF3306 domain-containing protein n=1 Tax=Bradyrhizobium septentrionale TaxID=1404411 RepID=A0A974A1Y0_9BRAD|nr:DUF3306 domain-containing protein [Bradyrhizobium septentrionale]UGY13506.1 DUF3306 domain-containing protein [Bradyrhizobium septentrionale]UGY22147.1 DUF3306 domain-containing protein [Bradyrhizobium septentrionale]